MPALVVTVLIPMREPIEGFPEMSRQFYNFRDKSRSIKLILADFTGDGMEARYVETLYDIDSITKLGVRIEIIHYGTGNIDPTFLDSLFTEGVRLEVIMRSALRHTRKAANSNIHNRGAKTIGDMTGRAVKSGSYKRSTITDAQALAIFGL